MCCTTCCRWNKMLNAQKHITHQLPVNMLRQLHYELTDPLLLVSIKSSCHDN